MFRDRWLIGFGTAVVVLLEADSGDIVSGVVVRVDSLERWDRVMLMR